MALKAQQPKGLYILMISVHGLIRSQKLELGRDADTGGQTTYVIELARKLSENKAVGRVDLLTRLIEDPELDADYASPLEPLTEKSRIVRMPCGPRRYIRKELLWPHLDQMVDKTLNYLRMQARMPDIIHSHYADAGYVAEQLSQLLGIPQVHTGHSLGRPKRSRLLASGKRADTIDKHFHFDQRIRVEEDILEYATMIIASTSQEVSEQYGLYQNSQRPEYRVIPPGTDIARFSPPGRRGLDTDLKADIWRFLTDPDKPIILAISRPVLRKNIKGLVQAYGEDLELQSMANLVIVAGTRQDIRNLEESQRDVLNDILLDIDRYDLWGKVAIPKSVSQEKLPDLYRLAARSHGLFVNPAFTEPFGLTLLEAAASGLPFVAPDDGGPRDILHNCNCGKTCNTLESSAIAEAIKPLLSDRALWKSCASKGLAGVRKYYSWDSHAECYLREITSIVQRQRRLGRHQDGRTMLPETTNLPYVHHLLISDIDNTLIGDAAGQDRLTSLLRKHRQKLGFGVATGRSLESALIHLRKHRIGIPDIMITSVGSEIHYGPECQPDEGWASHIRHKWQRQDLMLAMQSVPGLKLQAPENQREFKISYLVSPAQMPTLEEIHQHLQRQGLSARLIYSHEEFLDLLPIRASKGHAVRYLSMKWGIPLHCIAVAGDSGNDIEMLTGDTLGIVVGNHSPEVVCLKDSEQVYFAEAHYAAGILEGLKHYGLPGIANKPLTEGR